MEQQTACSGTDGDGLRLMDAEFWNITTIQDIKQSTIGVNLTKAILIIGIVE